MRTCSSSYDMISESILDALKALLACRVGLRGVLDIWKVCWLREEGQQARICQIGSAATGQCLLVVDGTFSTGCPSSIYTSLAAASSRV
jgi:hypothetical protein